MAKAITGLYKDRLTTVGISCYVKPENKTHYEQGQQIMIDIIQNGGGLYDDKCTIKDTAMKAIYDNDIPFIIGVDENFDIGQFSMKQFIQGELTPEAYRYMGAHDVIYEILNGDTFTIDNHKSDLIDEDKIKKALSGNKDRLASEDDYYTMPIKKVIEGRIKGLEDILAGKYNLPGSSLIDRNAIIKATAKVSKFLQMRSIDMTLKQQFEHGQICVLAALERGDYLQDEPQD